MHTRTRGLFSTYSQEGTSDDEHGWWNVSFHSSNPFIFHSLLSRSFKVLPEPGRSLKWAEATVGRRRIKSSQASGSLDATTMSPCHVRKVERVSSRPLNFLGGRYQRAEASNGRRCDGRCSNESFNEGATRCNRRSRVRGRRTHIHHGGGTGLMSQPLISNQKTYSSSLHDLCCFLLLHLLRHHLVTNIRWWLFQWLLHVIILNKQPIYCFLSTQDK